MLCSFFNNTLMFRQKLLLSFTYFLCIAIILIQACNKKVNDPDGNDDPLEIDYLPSWTEGYLDIHAINTGKGECTFFILPDGTTMLVDAGAVLTPPPESVPRPNGTRSPHEWITRYIKNKLKDFSFPKLDYIILTHFHWDHMGEITSDMPTSSSGAYKLSGITGVAEDISFGKIIDRGWPDYDWPVIIDDNKMNNYLNFIDWQVNNRGDVIEFFEPGVNDQIVLVKEPDTYTNFEIRNIGVNGYVWTGSGSEVQNHFPPTEEFEETGYPPENACSIAFRVSYGNFDYFTGGDISFRGAESGHAEDQWKNIEIPIASAIGAVDVLKANHHGNWDANCDTFLSTLHPRVIVIHTWLDDQPAYTTWQRMNSTKIFPDPPDIFVTNILDAKKIELGSEIYKMKSIQGHVVIRVEPGGGSYNVYVLDDSSESYMIKTVYGPYISN